MPRFRLSLALLAAITVAASRADARWAHDPSASLNVHAGSGGPYDFIWSGHDAVSDGAGGFIVGFDRFVPPASDDIYAQRVDAMGNLLWGQNGVAVCTASGSQARSVSASDGYGGVIIAWIDERGGTKDIYVQHLDATGSALWTPDGVLVCGASGDQTELQLVVNPFFATACLVWTDARLAGNTDIYARWISNSGVPQGAANGVALCAAAGNQAQPAIALASGRVVASWLDPRTDTGDIYAAEIDYPGTLPWAANGVVVCNATGYQDSPAICTDGGIGLVIAWRDSRVGNDIYAQKVSVFGGSGSWTPNGVPVCTAAGTQSLPRIVLDQQGGVVVAWSDYRSGLADIYAQRLDLYLGAALWTSDGVPVASGLGGQTTPVMEADGLGGVYFAYLDERAGNDDVYAQRLAVSGSPQWGAIPVGTGPSSDLYPSIVSDGANGCFIAFYDNAAGSADHVGIQRVDRWGYLGAEPWMADVADVPNDQGGKLKVSWNASPLDTDPLFENIVDYLVFRSAPVASVKRALRTAAITRDAGELLDPAAGRVAKLFALGTGATTSYWEYVGSQFAYHLPSYSFLASSTGDSMAGSNPYTSFMVQARANGGRHWESGPDSGYSVDNLPPAAPAPFTGLYSNGATLMQWGASPEPDLAHYRLYRGPSPSFIPGPAWLIAEPTATSMTDSPGAPYVYKLAAVDTHGNESPAATLVPAGAVAVDDTPRAALFLLAPSPNPVRRDGGATIRFGLPAAGSVAVELFDQQGRRVRRMADGTWPAGEHALRFEGRDDSGGALSPGLYFLRLKAAAGVQFARLVLLD